jgi:hypothetical protein
VDYCEPAELYTLGGLQPGALANPARQAGPVNIAANTISLDQHGFAIDAPTTLRVIAGGTLPAPLLADTVYYVTPVTESVFTLSATEGGATIDLTSTGARFMVTREIPFAAAIHRASRVIDQNLPAHAVPKDGDPIHELVRVTCAELAVAYLVPAAGNGNKSLASVLDTAVARLKVWARGVPLRGPNAPAHTNTAIVATAPYADRRGWSRYGGTT